MNFSVYTYHLYEKLKSFVETFTPSIIKYVFFEEQLCMSSPLWIFKFDIGQAQTSSV